MNSIGSKTQVGRSERSVSFGKLERRPVFRCRSTTFFAILFHINPLTNSLEHLRDVNIQVEKCTQFFMGKRPCRFINCRHSCLSLASRGQISTYHFLRKNLSNALNTTPDVRLRHTISILTKNLLIPDFLTNFPTELNSVLRIYIHCKKM